MKAYYIASSKFKEANRDEIYKKTINYISFKVGNKNLFYNDKGISLSEQVNPKDLNTAVVKSNKALKDSDVLIADMTDMSGGVGYTIAMAITEKKPTLVILNKEQQSNFTHNQVTAGSKYIQFVTYEAITDITKHIDKFLEDAKKKIDTKFILILPPEIDRYLNWAADHRRLHKAQIVRDAIEKQMKKDKEWKAYSES